MARRKLRFELLGRVLARVTALFADGYVKTKALGRSYYWKLQFAYGTPLSSSAGWTPHLCSYVIEGDRIVITCPRHRTEPTEASREPADAHPLDSDKPSQTLR